MYIELKLFLIAVLVTAYALVTVVDSGTPLSCDSHGRHVTSRPSVDENMNMANKMLYNVSNTLTAKLKHDGHSSFIDLMRTLKCLILFDNEFQCNSTTDQRIAFITNDQQNSCQFLTEVTSALVVVDILLEAVSTNSQISRVVSLMNTYKPLVHKLKATRRALSNVACAAVNRTTLIALYDSQRKALKSSESRWHKLQAESDHSQCNLDLKNMDHIRQKAPAIVFHALDLVIQAQELVSMGNVKLCFS